MRLSGTAAPPEDNISSLLVPENSNKNRQKNAESTFWYSVIRKDGEDSVSEESIHLKSLQSLPCVPTLDRDGPLPLGAYVLHGGSSQNSKASCKINIAIDLTEPTTSSSSSSSAGEMDPDEIVENLHRFIDSGFNSFQLKCAKEENALGTIYEDDDDYSGLQEWGEEQVLGRLVSQTPASVINHCHFTVPLHLSTEGDATKTGLLIRKTLLASLSRIGGDVLDCVQVQCHDRFDPKQGVKTALPRLYFLDVLDCLEEMKREGLIHSISARNLSPQFLRAAADAGFEIESNQLDRNLLSPLLPNGHSRASYIDKTKKDQNNYLNGKRKSALVATSPFAGGLLTQRFYQPEKSKRVLTRPLDPHQFTLLEQWVERHGKQVDQKKTARTTPPPRIARPTAAESMTASKKGPTIWETYQCVAMKKLSEIAQKHGTSIASVVLRWTLQSDIVTSTVVSCSLPQALNRAIQKPREKELRQVFTFELDEEDMEQLWELTACDMDDDSNDLFLDLDDEELEEMMMMMEGTSGLLLPRKGSSSRGGGRRQQRRPDDDVIQFSRTLWL